MKDRETARELAKKSIEKGDPVGWFEELYSLAEARPEDDLVPWAERKPNPHLISWGENSKSRFPKEYGTALVVGCGYGDDAEWLAQKGLDVTAFDISQTAISAARRRFPESKVNYQVADVLKIPAEWRESFDFVFEAYTLQVLQGELRFRAAQMIALTVKDTLLIIARGREERDDPGKMPWPLTREDLLAIQKARPDLTEVCFEDFLDESEPPPVRRFRVEYRHSQRGSSTVSKLKIGDLNSSLPVFVDLSQAPL